MDQIRNRLEAEISGLAESYQRAPGMILTEDDLRCHLVARFLAMPELQQVRATRDPTIMGTMVHAEVPWYDAAGRLRIRPDITILDPAHLSITRGRKGCRLPHKGFTFGGEAVILELKFIRARSGVNRKSVDAIRRDLYKIESLFAKLRRDGAAHEVFCYLVVFTKVDRRSTEFEELRSTTVANGRCRILYGSAMVA